MQCRLRLFEDKVKSQSLGLKKVKVTGLHRGHQDHQTSGSSDTRFKTGCDVSSCIHYNKKLSYRRERERASNIAVSYGAKGISIC